jgi:hypothetical protein
MAAAELQGPAPNQGASETVAPRRTNNGSSFQLIHTAHVGHGLRCWIWIAFLGPMGSQGLFKSPWILLNSPNFYNFAVAFATAMSTLLLGDCPYI